jgi:hypothetical protein
MFSFFKKLSLQEQIDRTKAEARRLQLTYKSAASAYTAVALQLGHKDAAKHFLEQVIREKF